MDDEGLESSEHRRALEALTMVNRLSLTARRVWREVQQLDGTRSGAKQDRTENIIPIQASGGGRRTAPPAPASQPRGRCPLRLLDVACGGGDVMRAVKQQAVRAGVALEVHGCDRSAVAVAHARDQARREGVQAAFFELDVLRSPIPEEFDLVCSSLFLHHLTDSEAVRVLSKMAASGRALLVQDLVRSRLGYWLAWNTLRLLSRSRVAQVDGPRSVQASFRIGEIRALARKAGLNGARIVPCWPQRFALSWSRE